MEPVNENRMKETIETIQDFYQEYKSAQALRAGISTKREALKNVLFSRVEDLVSMFGYMIKIQRENASLIEENSVLNDELAISDRANDDLRKQLANREEIKPKTNPARKKKSERVVTQQ